MRRLKADGTPSKVVELPPIHDIHRGLVGETPEECMATRERWIDYSALDAKVWGSVGECGLDDLIHCFGLLSFR